ncbi:MAG: FAD-dependent oxidoreductase [Caulobacter sp.]|nr:FAD-dependent oxidoreductase [Vitreoscilla sp.]
MKSDCVIAGGGPAGMMMGFLLARAGVDVVVLEKHADFLRDFRGDTIHPSTLDVIHELGLLDEFLRRPHDELRDVAVRVGQEQARIADFRHVPTHCKFLMMMPQWEFLDFIAGHARKLPNFHLVMQADVRTLVEEDGRVTGLVARTPDGDLEGRAALVVGADGRHSTIREQAGLRPQDFGAPMDVLWMRVSRRPDDPPDLFGQVDAGRMLVMIARNDYWQCALLIPKGSFDAVRGRGMEALHASLLDLSPWLCERVRELAGWDQVKLLTVAVDRLRDWARPGLLCIGDAAHAMSPIGGVGINLAVQDAVAAARLLAGPLRAGVPSLADLQRVQRRREWPVRVVQRMQITMQERLIAPVLASRGAVRMPWFLKVLGRVALLRRIPAWVIGVGVRRERVS